MYRRLSASGAGLRLASVREVDERSGTASPVAAADAPATDASSGESLAVVPLRSALTTVCAGGHVGATRETSCRSCGPVGC